MTIDEGIQSALDGECILFVGSGFSWGLKDYEGRTLPVGKQFALELSALAGADAIDDLELASQLYLDKFSDYHLADLLRTRFRVAEVSADHDVILTLPWTRIYTTNYDNAVEVTRLRNEKPVRSVTTSEHLKDLPRPSVICVHINGYVDRIRNSYINSQIQLTSESYLASSFDKTAWRRIFAPTFLQAEPFSLLATPFTT